MNKFGLICFYICSTEIFAYPVSSDPRYVLVPISLSNFNQQPRGPLDFIGNWIQSSDFFPLELNVPDTFSSIGNTVGGWANNVGNFAQNVGSTFQGFTQNVGSGIQGLTQNVGSGIQGLTQNVGSGIQSFTQGLTQRVPFLAAIVRPPGTSTQRFVVLIPARDFVGSNTINQNFNSNDKMDFNMNPDLMEIFP
ncbi:unnamed protein product [Psylliodes chrysocephalus]|uniref:Uncharacterized protein n=1 Tax=Psylliodes chrysocephalus TaxID=3402493 RepID=A0A9P0G737_9CUCU|nr:unnamed protein product [Psylliodes chrysocephala]